VADADAVCGAAYGQRSPDRVGTLATATGGGLGHPGRQHRAGGAEAAGGHRFQSWDVASGTRSRDGWEADDLGVAARVPAWAPMKASRRSATASRAPSNRWLARPSIFWTLLTFAPADVRRMLGRQRPPGDEERDVVVMTTLRSQGEG
jgi:hypothetical protein